MSTVWVWLWVGIKSVWYLHWPSACFKRQAKKKIIFYYVIKDTVWFSIIIISPFTRMIQFGWFPCLQTHVYRWHFVRKNVCTFNYYYQWTIKNAFKKNTQQEKYSSFSLIARIPTWSFFKSFYLFIYLNFFWMKLIGARILSRYSPQASSQARLRARIRQVNKCKSIIITEYWNWSAEES